ncbi:MAG TPA: hypothetical protein VGR27_12915 [Longimicrobiaceae bacterium]|nr:hypothetical protein [Longimicrobiaceae bacterium]
MRSYVIATLAAAALLVSASGAAAQVHADRHANYTDAARSVDLFLSQHRLTLDGERWDASGAGGRVLWSLAPLARSTGLSLLDRAAAGGYLVHSLGSIERREVWHYGVQADVRVAPIPLGRVDPIVSLGIGAVRAEAPIRPVLLAPERSVVREGDAPREGIISEQVVTSLSFTPGIGARVRVLPGLALRGDLRSLIDLRDERRHLELSGGISATW